MDIGTLKDRFVPRKGFGVWRLKLYQDGEAWLESYSATSYVGKDDPMHPKHPLFIREVYCESV